MALKGRSGTKDGDGMDIQSVRDLVHSLIVALSVVQAALFAIEKLLANTGTAAPGAVRKGEPCTDQR